jgi:uncharacterized protein (DUF1501 family)
MVTRRQFLTRTLRGSSLVALGGVVPQFLARTARAAEPGKDTILVVVEMTGGNDGLNTVIPYADDLYHKYRPTLRHTKHTVIRLNDSVGLHPGLQGLKPLWEKGRLAVVQGVGYPNPDRSHFESMDVWQLADPSRKAADGWLGRATGTMDNKAGGIPILHVGPNKLPLALAGAGGSGAVSVGGPGSTFKLEMGAGPADRDAARRKLIADVSAGPAGTADADLLSFVQRRQLQTLTAVDHLRELTDGPDKVQTWGGGLQQKLQLVGGLIQKGFGTRIFYVNIDGFDTHSDQAPSHKALLTELGDSIGQLFNGLGDDADRVAVMTYSEFGRRVQENGSRGTDHGAASCLFVAGGGVAGGVVGPHPSLADLDAGDLRHHTDFRRVYAALLDGWLGCDAQAVLGTKWDPLPVIKPKG